jgi:hypothetical protein
LALIQQQQQDLRVLRQANGLGVSSVGQHSFVASQVMATLPSLPIPLRCCDVLTATNSPKEESRSSSVVVNVIPFAIVVKLVNGVTGIITITNGDAPKLFDFKTNSKNWLLTINQKGMEFLMCLIVPTG